MSTLPDPPFTLLVQRDAAIERGDALDERVDELLADEDFLFDASGDLTRSLTIAAIRRGMADGGVREWLRSAARREAERELKEQTVLYDGLRVQAG